MAVRRGRAESVAGEAIDFDAHVSEELGTLDDKLASAERSARSAEALRRLKPDEATALLLKAEGHTYGEIGERQGWTYTKVNRAITEGRRRFLRTYAELESGEGCAAYRPGLAELARGMASAEALLVLRPHLRHCPACRAVIREMRGGRRRVAGWLPLPALIFGMRKPLDYATNIDEIGGRGAAAEPLAGTGRFAEIKLQLQHWLQRFHSSDVATTVQLTSSSGGGRGASIAAVIGICLSSAGAGTYCVATLVLPEPKATVHRAERVEPKRTSHAKAGRGPSSTTVARLKVPIATVTPTPEPSRTPTKPDRRAPSKSSTTRTATVSSTPRVERQEDPPPATPPVIGRQELGFEQTAPGANSSSAVRPAAAPATGGDEFSP